MTVGRIPSVEGGIQPTLLTAKGDLISATAASTVARLAVGSNDQILVADSTASTGLKWATPAAATSGMTLLTRATFSDVATTSTSFDGVFSSTYKTYLICIENLWGAGVGADLYFQLRYAGPTTQAATYVWSTNNTTMGTSTALAKEYADNVNQIQLSSDAGSSAERFSGQYYLTNAETTARTQLTGVGLTGRTGIAYEAYGYQFTNRTYTGLILSASTGNISGTVAVYGLATS